MCKSLASILHTQRMF